MPLKREEQGSELGLVQQLGTVLEVEDGASSTDAHRRVRWIRNEISRSRARHRRRKRKTVLAGGIIGLLTRSRLRGAKIQRPLHGASLCHKDHRVREAVPNSTVPWSLSMGQHVRGEDRIMDMRSSMLRRPLSDALSRRLRALSSIAASGLVGSLPATSLDARISFALRSTNLVLVL